MIEIANTTTVDLIFKIKISTNDVVIMFSVDCRIVEPTVEDFLPHVHPSF